MIKVLTDWVAAWSAAVVAISAALIVGAAALWVVGAVVKATF